MESLFTSRRRGGNAYNFFDPLGWNCHRESWPFIWLARKFKPGSRVNVWAYAVADRIVWHRVKRAWRV